MAYNNIIIIFKMFRSRRPLSADIAYNNYIIINSLEISVDHFLVLAGLGWLFEVRMCMRSHIIIICPVKLNIC